jgi:thiol-disulfide isomerase/thioredoxin
MMARLLFLAVICFSAFCAETHPTLAIGSSAPNFSLPGIDGKNHKLSDYAGYKVLVVAFTCNHCPMAQLYEQRIIKMVADYKGKGVGFVAIQPNSPDAIRLDELGYTDISDTLPEMKTRASFRHFNFDYLYDGDAQKTSEAYGPKATPHLFIFDKDRKLRYEGAVDNNQREALVKNPYARNAIDAILAGNKVPVETSAAFGCSTKWISKQAGKVEEAKKIAAEPVKLDFVSIDELKKLRLNQTGKVTLVDFWATWCGPCVHEMPDLETTYRMYRGREFDFITVSANMPDEKSGVLKLLEKQHISSRNLQFATDDTAAFQAAFDSSWKSGVPFTVLLGPDGKILYKNDGEVDILELRRVILGNLPDTYWIGHRALWAKK